jgi:hypothetical protein
MWRIQRQERPDSTVADDGGAPLTNADATSPEIDAISEPLTLETEISDDEAQSNIGEAVSARHSIARKHVLRLRRRHPEASPAEIIQLLERQYTGSITAAGTAIAVGGFAATVGISLIPAGGAAAAGAKEIGKHVTKHAAAAAAKATFKRAGKDLALGAAKSGAGRIAALLPAGEQQLQFEITAIFGLALADIHGIEYDRDQAHALVFGLTNERVSQKQIAQMATDVANVSSETTAAGGGAQWAWTLADALPGGAAQSLVRTMQTGQLDAVRDSMNGKQQTAVDYGVQAVSGGVTRFVFGRDVVKSARTAFPPPPLEFPAHLAVPAEDEDDDDEPNRAIAALENAAKTTGGRIADVADSATRVFRSVDLDGDGFPDEAQALTLVKGAGGAVAGAAGAVGGRVGGLFKRGKRGGDESTDEALESGPDVLEQIATLAALKDRGILTEDEFTAKKSELLSRL